MHTQVSSVQQVGRRETWSDDHVYVGMPCQASRAYGIPDSDALFGKPWAWKDNPNWPALISDLWAKRLLREPDFAKQVKDLHGKTLLCWCTAKQARRGSEVRCHARILAEYVELEFHARSK